MRLRQAHILIRMSHTAGIHSACSSRLPSSRARKIIDGQSLVVHRRFASRTRSLHPGRILRRLCHHIDPVARVPPTSPASRIHSTRCGRSFFPTPRRTQPPHARPPPQGHSLPHRLQPRRPLTRRTTATSSPMRDVVCRGIARRDPMPRRMAQMRRIRLRPRRSACTHQSKPHHNAQHHSLRRSAKELLRACADFRLSMAPLRHHHHKFLKVAAKPPSLFRLSLSPAAAIVATRMPVPKHNHNWHLRTTIFPLGESAPVTLH